MALNLRKDGPFVLRYLIESDLLHLVDLLILDKKWVEEYPSQKFPFKIIRPAEKGSLPNTLKSHNSNSLRSIFLDTQSLSDSKKLPEHGEKRNQNVSHTGVSPPAINKNSVPQNNAGGTIAKSDSDFSASSRKYDDLDSGREELGPVSHTSPKRNMERSSRKLKEKTKGQVRLYQTSASLVQMTRAYPQQDQKGKIDSSLLQSLDSWHCSKEDDNRKAPMES